MKDIVITSKRIKKEIAWFAGCFAIAFITNIVVIIIYKTPWHEIFSQIGYVVVIALVLYMLLLLIRITVLIALKALKGSPK